MWGIAWGIKMQTSVYKTEKSSLSTDKTKYMNGSGERIRTSDFRVMRPMHAFVMVCYLLLSSVMECDSPRVSS